MRSFANKNPMDLDMHKKEINFTELKGPELIIKLI